MSNQPIKFAFFGTPDRAVIALQVLKEHGYIPSLIVTQPDRPQGRKLVLTPPPVKIWATNEGINVIQPEDLTSLPNELTNESFDFFVVIAYGKILNNELLKIPKYRALNIHGSLLPELRGSSPIETAILQDMKETGVTIILMDEKMDHGPIIAQEKVTTQEWPPTSDELAEIIVRKGAELVAEAMQKIVQSEITPVEQDHSKATFTKKIHKEDGLVNLNDDPYLNYRKFKAYHGWPGIFFFKQIDGKETRVKITDARFNQNTFEIVKVIPEGKKEMLYSEFVTK